MAKAPRVGEAKTRFVPALSPEAASCLSACFIRDAAGNIAAAGRDAAIDGYIAYSPPGAESAFQTLLSDGTGLVPSRRTGLAASLLRCRSGFAGEGLRRGVPGQFRQPDTADLGAGRAPRGCCCGPGDRLVLGPAEDGGYYLIGLKRAHARLFEDIAWSTPAVFAQTLDRAREIGLAPQVLPRWYDVDDLTSLRRLDAELLAGRSGGSGGRAIYPAPHTAAFLRAGRAGR